MWLTSFRLQLRLVFQPFNPTGTLSGCKVVIIYLCLSEKKQTEMA